MGGWTRGYLMDSTYHIAAGMCAILALPATAWFLTERRKPILRNFLAALIFGSLFLASLFEYVQTGHLFFHVAFYLLGGLMVYFAFRGITRWWRYWGPA